MHSWAHWWRRSANRRPPKYYLPGYFIWRKNNRLRVGVLQRQKVQNFRVIPIRSHINNICGLDPCHQYLLRNSDSFWGNSPQPINSKWWVLQSSRLLLQLANFGLNWRHPLRWQRARPASQRRCAGRRKPSNCRSQTPWNSEIEWSCQDFRSSFA